MPRNPKTGRNGRRRGGNSKPTPAKKTAGAQQTSTALKGIEDSLGELKTMIAALGERLTLVESVRDAATSALREREARLANLAAIDAVAQRADIASIRLIVSDAMRQAGLVRLDEPEDNPDAFTEIRMPEHARGVVAPAYVDESLGRVVQQGRLESNEVQEAT